MPTIEEFDAYVIKLGHHDWTFEYSDDGSVWRRGKDNEKSLLSTANGKPELMGAYKAYIDYTFTNPDTSWPDRLIKRANDISALRQQILEAMVVDLIKTA